MATNVIRTELEKLIQAQSRHKEFERKYELENNTVKRAHLGVQLTQWANKVRFHKDRLTKIGTEATIVEVSGYITQARNQREKELKLGIKQPFKLYFTGLTIEESKEYFENIVKLKWENLDSETISFKSIPVGVLQVNYVKR